MMTAAKSALLAALAGLLSPTGEPAQPDPVAGTGGVRRFHHVHMNVVDPDRSAAFLAGIFPQTRVTSLGGLTALRTEEVFILFTKVDAPAPFSWDTAIWHIGWNSPDVAGDYRRLSARGVRFSRVPAPGSTSADLVTPDQVDVELALGLPTRGGSTPTAFNHVHLMSETPVCAADWYVRVLRLRRGHDTGRLAGDCRVPSAPRTEPGGLIRGPAGRVFAGDIMVVIYPYQKLEALSATPMKAPAPMASGKGHVLDHIAFEVDDTRAEAKRLRALGVRIIEPPRVRGISGRRSMMIEGPDAIRIELVETADPRGASPD